MWEMHLPGTKDYWVPYHESETESKITVGFSKIGLSFGYLELNFEQSDAFDHPTTIGYEVSNALIWPDGAKVRMWYWRYGNYAPGIALERGLELLADDLKVHQRLLFNPRLNTDDDFCVEQNTIRISRHRNQPVEMDYGLNFPEARVIGENIVSRFPTSHTFLASKPAEVFSLPGDRNFYQFDDPFGSIFGAMIEGFESLK